MEFELLKRELDGDVSREDAKYMEFVLYMCDLLLELKPEDDKLIQWRLNILRKLHISKYRLCVRELKLYSKFQRERKHVVVNWLKTCVPLPLSEEKPEEKEFSTL